MIRALTDENVLAQLDNLKTIPCVGAKLATGAVDIHGWVYDIQTGHMRIWIEADGRWHAIEEVDDNGVHTASA